MTARGRGGPAAGSQTTGETDVAGRAVTVGEHPLVTLDEEQCWSLLRSRQVGRLAWNTASGPTVVPVNYSVTEGGIVLRTTSFSGTALELEAEDTRISFQVDQLDASTRTGWSVLARGKPRIDWTYGRVDAPEIDVWPTGPRPLRVHITVLEISGRSLTG